MMLETLDDIWMHFLRVSLGGLSGNCCCCASVLQIASSALCERRATMCMNAVRPYVLDWLSGCQGVFSQGYTSV